jgi:hypothetical protein
MDTIFTNFVSTIQILWDSHKWFVIVHKLSEASQAAILFTYVPDGRSFILGYYAVQFAESQPMFRGNISPPSLGSKNKPSKKQRRLSKYVPPKRRLTFSGLQSVVFQKIYLLMTTGVRTSNPTLYLGCTRLESRPEQRLTWLRLFVTFLWPSWLNAWVVPKIRRLPLPST